jgi:uncharacterized protein
MLLVTIAVSLGGCVQRLFYMPDRVVYDTPARAGLKYEPVTFRSLDGTRLSGWFIPAADRPDPRSAKGTVVHFHGNAQNLTSHWSFLEWMPARGYNVFVFDYRGYGESEGTPETRGVVEDSGSALDYIRTRKDVDPDRLLVFGQSLGGAKAIAAVGGGKRAGVRAVAVEAAFSSYSAIAHTALPGAGLMMDDTYSPDRFVAKLAPIPLLLVHGTADSVIPHSHSATLLAAASEPKRLVTVEGAAHLEMLQPRFGNTYRDVLAAFFEAALAARQ